MPDCIFCKIIAGEVPAEFLYKDDNVVVFKDINPQGPVHVLIVPTKHIESILDLTPEDNKIVGEMMLQSKAVAEKLRVAEKGFRLVINTGRDARQAIYHIHAHMIGGRKMTWPPG